MAKVIMIVCDALRDDTAAQQMGYLEHLVETRAASRYRVIAELPTMSRPLYETLHTGVPSSVHGITNNQVVRRSNQTNVFQMARDAGKVTAAAAFCWFSELYNQAPYDPIMHRETDDDSLAIQHGRFYLSEQIPDLEVFAAGASLLTKFFPDYLLIHPMGMDTIGEKYGADTAEYRKNAIVQDQIMAYFLPTALQLGYTVLVTADHGINADGAHGGTADEVRLVPMYVIRPDHPGHGDTGQTISQLRVAPTLCKLLDLPTPNSMAQPHFLGIEAE
ncbi:MAG: alkaline phosphatase family protein [bacterium]|nr:alkaline phosphatase family protein [bacterium]